MGGSFVRAAVPRIQLTKLVVLSWALGIPGDGVVIAAALSTQAAWAGAFAESGFPASHLRERQDVFKMAAPANCRNLEDDSGAITGPLAQDRFLKVGQDFPAHLAHNYITRARFDDGQFSEPIMCPSLQADECTNLVGSFSCKLQ